MNHGKLEGLSRLPGITECLKWWLPEHGVFGLLGTIALAFGFASVASVTQESFSSRLFRWFLIPLGLAFFAAILPLAEGHTCLCGSIDDNSWLDEIVFLVGCLSLGFAGWRYARQKLH
jgi:drug/metabolite transporter (DMT)-like permease